MALDSYVKTDLNGTVTLSDGTGAPLSIVLAFDNGDFTAGPYQDLMNEIEAFERRGKFTSLAPGSRFYPAGSFTAMVHQFTDASADVLSDFLLRNNKFSAAISTSGTNHPVYTVDVKFDIEGTDFGGVDSTVTFADCVVRIDNITEGRPTTWSVSWTCYGTVTGDLGMAEVT